MLNGIEVTLTHVTDMVIRSPFVASWRGTPPKVVNNRLLFTGYDSADSWARMFDMRAWGEKATRLYNLIKSGHLRDITFFCRPVTYAGSSVFYKDGQPVLDKAGKHMCINGMYLSVNEFIVTNDIERRESEWKHM